MTRAEELKYLQQKIHEIEESEKSKNSITKITIYAWIFVEIAEHFINSCPPENISLMKQVGEMTEDEVDQYLIKKLNFDEKSIGLRSLETKRRIIEIHKRGGNDNDEG